MNSKAEYSQPQIEIAFGDVREKVISTPNHFVSHMLEHIAWRMGLKVIVRWGDTDWRELGRSFGAEIARFTPIRQEAAALGMIDDGSAVVTLSLGSPAVRLSASAGVDLDWFLQLRCEQVASGEPLVQLLQGISSGLSASIDVEIVTVEDAHHTWEGVYRALGIALAKIYAPQALFESARADLQADRSVETPIAASAIEVLARGTQLATVRRGTAETAITATVDCSPGAAGRQAAVLSLDVDESIAPAVRNLAGVFEAFAVSLGAQISIDFRATMLSSSHVVLEDIGLVVGRALLEILKLRMDRFGVNGAGSNVWTTEDCGRLVRVGVSVEGRKFWKLVPLDGETLRFKQAFVLGHDVDGLRTEDLDDFLDGLAGGMSASIMVHVRDYSSIPTAWTEIFSGLGAAIREAFDVNPCRLGVPPGVKATLA